MGDERQWVYATPEPDSGIIILVSEIPEYLAKGYQLRPDSALFEEKPADEPVKRGPGRPPRNGK